MQKYIKWYLLLLKAQVKRLETWLVLICMGILVLFVANATLPDASNSKVLIYSKNEQVQNKLLKELKQKDSIFQFELASDEESLKQDVLSGRAECGFVFSEDIEEKIIELKPKNTITYYASSFSLKGEVAKETIYTALLKVESENLLRSKATDVYEDVDEEMLAELVERQREYLESDELFYLEWESVETVSEHSVRENKTFPIHGTIALFVFLTIYFMVGEELQIKRASFSLYLCKMEKMIFSFIRCLAAITPQLIVGIGLIILLGVAQNLFIEIMGIICLIGYSWIWCQVLRVLLRKMARFMAWIIPILLMNIAICPLYLDVATFIPAISYVRYLIPLGIYLNIL